MKIKKTQAAILTKLQTPLTVEHLDLPNGLVFGQVLVKVHYSTICGAQIGEIDGAKGEDKYIPHLLGHEGSGEVIEVGRGVKFVQKGDHVVLHWRMGAGIESEGASYLWKKKKVNAGKVTTFQTYTVVSENRVTKIPTDFDLKLAPLFGCAITTALGVVNNDAQLKIGQSLVVFGLGGVGLNIVQGAALVSSYPIIGIDILDTKLKMAKQYGATHTFNSLKSIDFVTDIKKIVGEKGADVVIDATGNTSVMELAYELTHPEGKTILVGVPKLGKKISIYSLPIHFKKTLHGSHGGSSEPHIDIPRYIRLIEAGKLSLKGLITHEYPLSKINEAIEVVRSGKAGRVILKMV